MVSTQLVKFPVRIGKLCIFLEANVVANDIPLLLSQTAMQKARMVIDFNKGKVSVLGETVDMIKTSTGHLCIPLSNFALGERGEIRSNVVLQTEALCGLTTKEKEAKALKLHRQFCHASKWRLCKLVRDSKDFNDPEFLKVIEKCCDSCKLCLTHKRVPPRPVVGMPLADNFNQVVCMDLKQHIYNKSWILHLIDSATRYSAACLVSSKDPDEIIMNIFQMWIAYFGYPFKFLTENSGEFVKPKFCASIVILEALSPISVYSSPSTPLHTANSWRI